MSNADSLKKKSPASGGLRRQQSTLSVCNMLLINELNVSGDIIIVLIDLVHIIYYILLFAPADCYSCEDTVAVKTKRF